MRERTEIAEPAEPWRAFLADLDAELSGPIELHCLGGFVVTQLYGVAGRETADIDFLAARMKPDTVDLEALAGLHSQLHRRFRLYLQHVTVVTPPCDYERRLVRMFPAAQWRNLTLLALDATDLALSKLERNSDRDRDDFLRLVKAGLIDRTAFQQRYAEELRPYLLARHEWHDQTFALWIAMADETAGW
jgi:hypothetical protein